MKPQRMTKIARITVQIRKQPIPQPQLSSAILLASFTPRSWASHSHAIRKTGTTSVKNAPIVTIRHHSSSQQYTTLLAIANIRKTRILRTFASTGCAVRFLFADIEELEPPALIRFPGGELLLVRRRLQIQKRCHFQMLRFRDFFHRSNSKNRIALV